MPLGAFRDLLGYEEEEEAQFDALADDKVLFHSLQRRAWVCKRYRLPSIMKPLERLDDNTHDLSSPLDKQQFPTVTRSIVS